MKKSITYSILLSALMTIIGLNSCKKENPEYPYKEIQRFSFKSSTGETIKGVISNSSNEIIIYWPEEQALPTQISPDITVSERANISPASGEAVPFNSTATFTVTAQDGSKTTYTLKPVVNYIKPSITRVFTGGSYEGKKYILLENSPEVTQFLNTVSIEGDFFKVDLQSTKMFFIKQDGTEVQGTIKNLLSRKVDATIGSLGSYTGFRLVNNGYSITQMTNFEVIAPFVPYFINEPIPSIAVKPGQELTIKGKLLDKISSFQIYDADYNLIDLPIKSANSEQITLTIPTNMPLGSYTNGAECSMVDGHYYGITWRQFTTYDVNLVVIE